METSDIRELICAPLCTFYRPDKDEDLCCGGFMAVRKLAGTRKIDAVAVSNQGISAVTEDGLYRALCSTCPFYGDGCDFAEWKRGDRKALRQDLRPCGGFLFLGLNIEGGRMDITDINRVI